MLSGQTRFLAVIGDPVRHSLSPRIHNHFIALSGLDYVYLALPVAKGHGSEVLRAANLMGLAGCNVTMPLKEEAFAAVSVVSEEALSYGTVNTVVFKEGQSYGYNTDAAGFLASLASSGRNVRGEIVTLLGAGGAAKALAVALTAAGATLRICARNRQQAVHICPTAAYYPFANVAEAADGADVLVNATPLGMNGFADFASFDFLAALPHHALVYDLIYAPRQTGLLTAAASRKLDTMNGLSHLIHQAALSFALFTGVTPDKDTVSELLAIL